MSRHLELLYVDDARTLEDVVAAAADAPRYAIDTEFHRERTYFPRLALVQIQFADVNALIDPLAVDPRLLAPLMESSSLAIVHAAQQDLEVLRYAVGVVPRRMFDCQLAAGFLGYSTPSLATLAQSLLKIELSKGDRMTDWLRRPLTASQCDYARSDVLHLERLYDIIGGELANRGRLDWVHDACEEMRTKPYGDADPQDAWLKIREARSLKGAARGAAQALAEWREKRAMTTNVPVRRILGDMALVSIAQAAPKSTEDLAHVRGVDERSLGGSVGREILAAVRDGVTRNVSLPVADGEGVDKRMRPLVTLITAWIAELARQHELDPALLATTKDVIGYVGGGSSRLSSGWRRDLVGEDLEKLMSGRAGLGFAPHGGLVLIHTDK